MKSTKNKLKSNYDHFDYVCIFCSSEEDEYYITVKVRRYQCSIEYKQTKEALIEVYDRKTLVLSLIDNGNGIEIGKGTLLNYADWQYLTCAVRAYDCDDKHSLKMRKIEV